MAAKKNKYLVFRDTKEHKGYGWVFDKSDQCEGTLERMLKTGDYSLDGYYENKIFVIERKGSISEFVGNITNAEKWEDFKNELVRLEEFRYPFIILEFPITHLMAFPQGSAIPRKLWHSIRIQPSFLLKRFLEIQLHFKTKIIWADNAIHGKQIAASLFKRIVEHVKPE